MLYVQLKVESIDDPSTPGTVDPTRPTIRFKGTSRGGAPSESNIRGKVCVEKCGAIRWHIVSVYKFSFLPIASPSVPNEHTELT